MKKPFSIALLLSAVVFFRCTPDTIPPSMRVVMPRENEAVPKDTVRIAAVVTDNHRMHYVTFRVDSLDLGADSTPWFDTFDYRWDASHQPNMTAHTAYVKAYDRAGNTNERIVHFTLTGAGPTYHSGPVTTNQVWTKLGSPHIILDSVTVTNNAVLTIEPGAKVYFEPGAYLACGTLLPGRISAIGEPEDAILFTSNSASPAIGDWKQILIASLSNGSSFAYCTLEYAGRDGVAALEINERAATVRRCKIHRCRGIAVDCGTNGAFAQFDNNLITNNDSFPLRIASDYVRTIGEGNDFRDNLRPALEIAGGTVTTSTTWPVFTGVDYYISSTVTVGDAGTNPTLTIAPRSVLKFARGAELAVGLEPGGLLADGLNGRILFTSAQPMPQPGDWVGITFYSRSLDDQCRLRKCRIEYGGDVNGGNIVALDAVPYILTDSIGYSAGWGIRLGGTSGPNPDTLLRYNWFYENATGDIGR